MCCHSIFDGLQTDFKKRSETLLYLILGKVYRTPIPKLIETRSTNVVVLVYSNVYEQPEQSLKGSDYFASFINDYSWYCWVYLKI